MVHDMMLHRGAPERIISAAPIAIEARSAECHVRIGTGRIRAALLAILAVGQGRTAEAEEDGKRDYAERFHWSSPGLSASPHDVAYGLKVCGLPADTIKSPFRELNSILIPAAEDERRSMDFIAPAT
jgi:hypothetical protein